ncbi:hypothetical protein [Microbacterium hatanonis]|uniref:DUF4352 domain-containing protein n=1 Tax=Microbacterium hatanonis TaxID=404366 RepID=A0A5C8HXX1_9MICO|nr:hypothetical protein [Microbacterium hatanonis]TXK09935.1 hypothetical protein FVP77_13730 [Microbacterium hatanonis]
MKPWLVWTVGLALVVAAWGVVQLTPDEDIATTPFVVPAAIGEEAVLSTFTVTATDARLGEAAVARGWEAEGTWLVVDLEVTGRGQERDALLRSAASLKATFVVDGLTYRASERPSSLINAEPLVDIPRVGSLAFELPPEMVGQTGTLRIFGDLDTRLAQVAEVPIDLAALDAQPEVELLRDGWAAR